MAISVDCPQCQQAYSLKDDHAGKKFKCKTCGHIVEVPASDEPWNDLDDLEGGELVEQQATVRPLAGERFREPRKKKSKRTASVTGGLPIPIIVAIICEALLIAFNGLNAVGSAMQEGQGGGVCISVLRIGLEAAAIIGYLQGNGLIRMVSIWLSVLGIILLVTCSVFLISWPQMLPDAAQEYVSQQMWLIVVLLVGQVTLMAGIIASLMMPSSSEFFD